MTVLTPEQLRSTGSANARTTSVAAAVPLFSRSAAGEQRDCG
ncbi:hypothetical protein [Arthrobacter sp. FW306-04-A]